MIVIRIEQRKTAGQRQFRFLARGNHFQGEAGFLFHPAHEIVAVAGRPSRLGRDTAGGGDPAARHFFCADPERIDRSLDRVLRQRTLFADTFSEADDTRKAVDDAETIARRMGDQQTTIVGPEIKRCEYTLPATGPVATTRPVSSIRPAIVFMRRHCRHASSPMRFTPGRFAQIC